MQKLVDKKSHDARCAYCMNARIPKDGTVVLCKYKGITEPDSSCRKFKYDPLKRVPTKLKLSSDFSEDEFKL